MRKHKKGRKLHRKTSQRKALLKGLATALVLEEKIKTTEAKAKELQPFIERYITYAKKGDLSARRIIEKIFSKEAGDKLFKELGSRYKTRRGGYTRITKIGVRAGDKAKMAVIELLK